ncbi:transcription initiation factor TFIID subunit 3 [Gadus macrocephalus]|uniref:transcription initiation factor TFIID subunit 3 n=1 Tax=Gadus macrocephalus TaxID=80720 RepID=UPI0028CB495D|nr:transcription initiation factor TFIID subunit 3 [Gadus macrocephalus]
MCESYARSLLRVSVAQICAALGWDAVQLTACDLLADVLHRYLQQLSRGCHRYSELYGRTDPALDDVGQAFRLLGVSLSELEDYVNNLEPVSFAHQTPLFPITKNNVLQFPQPGAREAEERKEHIPDYLPPLVSLHEEEEEEEVLPDMGTSAEAMQVPLEDDEDDLEDEEAVNDENHPLKRHLDSPDAAMGMMPTSKRPRLHPGLSPEWGVEPREPLTSLNPQRLPPGVLASHDSLGSLSPETPTGAPPSFRPLPPAPRHGDHKSHSTPSRKSKGSSPGRQRTKSPKGGSSGAPGGGALCSPRSSKDRKKSPGRTKSPKSPKISSSKGPPPPPPPPPPPLPLPPPGKTDTPPKLPPLVLSERLGKENIHTHQSGEEEEEEEEGGAGDGGSEDAEPDDQAIEESIDAVIAQACAEHEPDPFAFSSGSESESNGFSSPRRLTIMEPCVTPKLILGPPPSGKDHSTPPHLGPGNWTMDDSINEVLRKVNQGGPGAATAAPMPQLNPDYLSSGSPSPPTPEPALLKALEERIKTPPPLSLPPPADVKKKLKKELKTKLKSKKEKDKPKDKERAKLKEKSKDKSRDKGKELAKEAKLAPWKGDVEPLFGHPRDFVLMPEAPPAKMKSKEADGSGRKDKEKHKDKKKDKERSSKKDKAKNKDKGKEEKQKLSALAPFALADLQPLFSPAGCLRLPSMLPPLPPVLQEKEAKGGKEKEKKKDKKEKKKKKDKEKEREKAREKEREKEEKKREKEREKEKREKEKEKAKERIRLEKVKVDVPASLPSPVIPRLTLRVGAGQDKIVISKVVPSAEPKTPAPKAPTPKAPPPKVVPPPRPRSPPPPPLPPIVIPPLMLPPISLLAAASSLKTPVRSVVTETVSTYVIRDESGNQIWICPGCNKPDDGSPMIGCDGCNDWYHWPCVGILTAPPEDQQWFCVKCTSKKKDKKHKKRKHKLH